MAQWWAVVDGACSYASCSPLQRMSRSMTFEKMPLLYFEICKANNSVHHRQFFGTTYILWRLDAQGTSSVHRSSLRQVHKQKMKPILGYSQTRSLPEHVHHARMSVFHLHLRRALVSFRNANTVTLSLSAPSTIKQNTPHTPPAIHHHSTQYLADGACRST